jgi:hypothetical protein
VPAVALAGFRKGGSTQAEVSGVRRLLSTFKKKVTLWKPRDGGRKDRGNGQKWVIRASRIARMFRAHSRGFALRVALLVRRVRSSIAATGIGIGVLRVLRGSTPAPWLASIRKLRAINGTWRPCSACRRRYSQGCVQEGSEEVKRGDASVWNKVRLRTDLFVG